MTVYSILFALLLQAAGGLPAPPPPASRDTVLERRTRQVASELRCPVCQGLSIADSPSELALEMKSVVRDQLAAGKSEEEVRQYFLAKYGEWILLEPKPTGANLAVYLLPLALVGGGLVLILRVVRRWSRPAMPPPDATPSP